MRVNILCVLLALLQFSCTKTENDVENWPIPEQPIIISPLNNMSLGNCVSIQWDTLDYVNQYHIQIATDTFFQVNLSLVEDEEVQGFKAKQTFDLSNSDYFVRMRAENDTGNSDWSEIVNFNVSSFQNVDCFPVNLSKPSLSSPSDGSFVSDDYVTLSWQAVANAERYSLVISENSANNVIYSNSNVYDNQRVVQDFEEGNTYYWRVLAAAGSSTSGWSDTWSFEK